MFSKDSFDISNSQCLHICTFLHFCLFDCNNHAFSLARKKRQAELETYMRRMLNRIKKDLLIDTHKVKTTVS